MRSAFFPIMLPGSCRSEVGVVECQTLNRAYGISDFELTTTSQFEG